MNTPLLRNLISGFTPRPAPIPSVDFSGEWKNGLGSEMTLRVLTSGFVEGTYRTNVGLPPPTEEFELRGFASGDLIAFVVNFGAYGSLTAWAGQHTVENGAEKIHTLWHLAQNVPDQDEPDRLWAGILAGCNVFTRV